MQECRVILVQAVSYQMAQIPNHYSLIHRHSPILQGSQNWHHHLRTEEAL